jgi:pimeloyl-ACP methyl ester carboxylesterase
LLTAEGTDGGISFDVIVPSYPGFAFSDKPSHPGMDQAKTALLLAGLMKALGYKQFLVHGGDLGSGVAEQLAIQFPDRVMGMHLTDVPFQHLFSLRPEQLSPAEKAWMQAGQKWQLEESAYAMEMSTKPQTLAYALNDSPIGLAAWIIEKFHAWTDGNLESVYTRDELLTNLTIYWVTQSAGSAARMYYEMFHHPRQERPKTNTLTAFYICPKDLVPAPREFAERVFQVKQWTETPHGGHFAAMEQPNELAADIFRFAESYAAEPAGV